MSRNEYDDWRDDDRREAIEQRKAMAWHRCRCGDDLPGTCPGVDSCPYSGENDKPDDDEDERGEQ